MRSWSLAFIVGVGLTHCGGVDAQVAFTLRHAALSAEAYRSLALSVYRTQDPGAECSAFIAQPPYARTDLPPQAFTEVSTAEGAPQLLRLDGLQADVPYPVWLEAFDDQGALVGVGCADNVRMIARQSTEVSLTLTSVDATQDTAL
jgi:hypothetical protein